MCSAAEALHICSFLGHNEALQILLSSRADVHAKDATRCGIIHMCGATWVKRDSTCERS